METGRVSSAVCRFVWGVILLILSAVIVAGCGGGGSGPKAYSVQALVGPPGAELPDGNDLNNHGQVVGSSWVASDPSYTCQAVLWDSGIPQILMVDADAVAINDFGQVLIETDPEETRRLILWENGGTTDLGVLPGCTRVEAGGINNLGQVVGTAYGADGSHGFIWDRGSGMREISGVGWEHIVAWDISDSGIVIASGFMSSTEELFLWQNGVITRIPQPPFGGDAFLARINQAGQLMASRGHYNLPCVYSGGSWDSFGPLGGWDAVWATSINDSGQMVGTCESFGAGFPLFNRRAVIWDNGAAKDLGDL